MSGLFITATGTEIGKTFVTCALAHQLRALDRPVRAIKPVVSGFDPHQPGTSDCAELLAALSLPLDQHLDELSPWRFQAPLSPDMAAAAEQRQVPFGELLRFCRAAAAEDVTLLIEGIGGAMVPLDDRHTVLDWMAALGFPALMVTGSYLGTLSHTLTTCAAVAARNIHIQAVLVSESPDNDIDLEATCTSLRRFLPGVPVASIPRISAPNPWRNAPDLLAVAGLKTASQDRTSP
jgi:dethiobiotin synthetase